MKSKILLGIFLVLTTLSSKAQWGEERYQYFDGNDTIPWNTLQIVIDSVSAETWQIGKPQKALFSKARTIPNALVTDTVEPYAINDTSSFSFTIEGNDWGIGGIIAIQWMQKLDLEKGKDFGLIEASLDSGNTWENVVDQPWNYNYFGYDSANYDTLPNGQYGLTGTDTAWKNVWLCYDMNWLAQYGVVKLRFTIVSDSVQSGHEGWMIDNFSVHPTIFHTINEVPMEEYMQVSPNPTTGRVNIRTKKSDDFHIIEEAVLLDNSGNEVQRWGRLPVKTFFDIGEHPNGIYHLRVRTNKQTEVFKIVLTH